MGVNLRHIGAAVLLLPGAAHAGCTVPTFVFHPERNDNVVIEAVTDHGQLCTHKFAEGAGYHFTSVKVVRPPEHGTAQVTGGSTLGYRADPSFQGKDFYQIRVCATKVGQPAGCSSLYFVFTVS